VRSRDSRPQGGGRFPDTSWGLVLAARDDDGRRSAFGTLYRRYWTPIYACLRRQGFSAADAKDLVQGFFLHLVEHRTIERADPERGRFRSFLIGALRWFLDNENERERARKRGGEYTFVPIDSADIEATLRLDVGSHAALEMQFDRHWAHALLRNALREVQAEYVDNGQGQMFEALQPYLDPNNAAVSYATLAGRLDRSEGAVKVAVHRLRGRFREALRHEVECTVATAREVEDELAHLRDVLDNESLGVS
jgi:RNA polymerase sigma factor (sigma-70 family)